MQDAEQQARLILSSAMGIRDYTDQDIEPNLAHLPANQFHEETVPSFAAQTVFRSLAANDRAYSYREPALNPTSVNDRATSFEVELIRRFRDDPSQGEITGTTELGDQRVFYLAQPIKITDGNCLACHDTPARAPAAMLAKYGPNNGFGWHLNETVGAQILTVPVTQQFRSTLQIVALLTAGLTLIFAIAYFALSAALQTFVIGPMHNLTEAADTASRTASTSPPLPVTGVSEIRALSEAVQRLRISLAKALAQLSRKESKDSK
jgi:protein-histidine pros-kinase